ncbi:MAG TPA: 6-phosphogluconolactonase [Jatrophihabitans sp.]|jgi:6-phosphogluconolactonase
MTPQVVVAPTADALVADVVAQLVPTLRNAIEEHGRAALALTAGSVMESVWTAIAASSGARELDWASVDVFFGDERFVPEGTADRNALPARTILFDLEPFSAAAWYPMPSSDGEFGDDLDAAAAGYAATLAAARRPDDTGGVPSFDVVLLGIGPDGHCCSLFPDHPSAVDPSTGSGQARPLVIAVRDSPKPPPLRISLSFGGLNTARQIWVVASGAGKAEAAMLALGGADPRKVPSAGARGTDRTIWFLDQDAASQL